MQAGAAQAQSTTTDPELEALIPDSAVANPQDWAKAPPLDPAAPNPETPTPVTDAQPPVPSALPLPAPAPDTPLVDRTPAGEPFTLPWPGEEAVQMAEIEPLSHDPELAAELAGAEGGANLVSEDAAPALALSERIEVVWPADMASFPERGELESRFLELSAIEDLRKDGGGEAQLTVRARADARLLARLLEIYGYYDADVTQAVVTPLDETDAEKAARQSKVRFAITPGPRFRYDRIDLGELEQVSDGAALRAAFEIHPFDPVLEDKLLAERDDLDEAMAESGHAFARIAEPQLTIDHRRDTGDLLMPVTPGGRYVFGEVTSNLPKFLSGKHLATIARFDPGDPYKRSEVTDLRRAIAATGLVSSVTVSQREVTPPQGETPGVVALDVSLAKAKLRTIAGEAGYDSGEGPRVEVRWEHRNLFPPEGMLRLRAIAGTKEQLGGVTFRRNNFGDRDQVLTIDAYASATQRDAFNARQIGLSAHFEKLTTLIFQKPWVWSAGLEFVASSERESKVTGVTSPRTSYYTAALPLRVAYDGSNDLLNPTTGFRAALRLSPEFSRGGGRNATYARIQADASYYRPFGDNVVAAARARVGMIPGAPLEQIAPSRRFYAGGGGSVRGYGYQAIGPRNAAGQPNGGRSLSEFSLEARVRTPLFGGAMQVVPFIDAGAVDRGSTPSLHDIRFGAGVGVRYLTGFGPIRVDVGTPLNRRKGDSRIGVYVSLGQSF